MYVARSHISQKKKKVVIKISGPIYVPLLAINMKEGYGEEEERESKVRFEANAGTEPITWPRSCR